MRDGWSDEELSASLDAYREMAAKEASGEKYSKKQIYRDLEDRFGRSAKAFEYRMQNISAVLDELGLPWIQGLKPAANVGAGIKPRLVALIEAGTAKELPGKFKHGSKRTWELALEVIEDLGGTATASDIAPLILRHHPDYNEANLRPDLAMLSVNDMTRTAFAQNFRPRRTDHGSEYDRLFKVGSGSGQTYERYDPTQHGVWEIFADASSGTKSGAFVRRVTDPTTAEMAKAAQEAQQSGAFDPDGVTDARDRVLASIVRRRGQPAFRAALLKAYDNACAITGCDLTAVLEAAHVHPYKGEDTNVTSNGLLLRADIHTLFDLHLIAVDSATLSVMVAPALTGTDYGKLQGIKVRTPTRAGDGISMDALEWHRSRCAW